MKNLKSKNFYKKNLRIFFRKIKKLYTYTMYIANIKRKKTGGDKINVRSLNKCI